MFAACVLGGVSVALGQRQVDGGLFRLLDANNDGEISAKELAAAPQALATLDKDKDGSINRDELAAVVRTGRGGRPGEVITPAAKGERIEEKLEVGDEAPDFTLPLVSGKDKLTLSSFRDKRPVVLIFASYT